MLSSCMPNVNTKCSMTHYWTIQPNKGNTYRQEYLDICSCFCFHLLMTASSTVKMAVIFDLFPNNQQKHTTNRVTCMLRLSISYQWINVIIILVTAGICYLVFLWEQIVAISVQSWDMFFKQININRFTVTTRSCIYTSIITAQWLHTQIFTAMNKKLSFRHPLVTSSCYCAL